MKTDHKIWVWIAVSVMWLSVMWLYAVANGVDGIIFLVCAFVIAWVALFQ